MEIDKEINETIKKRQDEFKKNYTLVYTTNTTRNIILQYEKKEREQLKGNSKN